MSPSKTLSRTVSFEKVEITEEAFSQCSEESCSSSSSNTNITQTPSTTADSKSIWKQIFSKPVKPKAINDEMKEQWSTLDKEQSSNYSRFSTSTPGVKRTCPFYKKIPGK